MKPLLVGELNPREEDDHYALYPLPPGSAGDRLCSLIMGLHPRDYLQRFDRLNLCHRLWSGPVARVEADHILAEPGERRILLLGRKVAVAFGCDYRPLSAQEVGGKALYLLPHPSGANRWWTRRRVPLARAFLRKAGLI